MSFYHVCSVKYVNGSERTYHSMTNVDYNDFLANVFSSFIADDFDLPLSYIEFKTVNYKV